MKRILVTGGAGFIGSEYIDYILKKYGKGVSVLCADKLTYAGKAQPEKRFSSFDNFSFSKVDICDNEAIDRLFAEFKPDVAVNFAAESHVDKSIASPEVFYKTNLLGTVTLLDACRKFGIGRFHQISTDEVYGSAAGEREFFENDPLLPSSPYSSSKASADLAVLAYAKTFGIDVTITRSSNNYGHYQFPEKLIPVAVCSLLCGKKVPLYGKGESVRDWLFVRDNCAAIDRVIECGKAGEIYNVAGNYSVSNATVVNKIIGILGVPADSVYYVPDRPGGDARYRVNDDKLNALGVTERKPFDEGLRETVEWYKQNEKWWKPLFLKAEKE